jgi:hypothetical protein
MFFVICASGAFMLGVAGIAGMLGRRGPPDRKRPVSPVPPATAENRRVHWVLALGSWMPVGPGSLDASSVGGVRLDPAALARFEADWTAATARARDEYSLLPARYFVEHWFSWVAVARWPELAARLRACERVVAESPDQAERRAAAAEISQILRRAETLSA